MDIKKNEKKWERKIDKERRKRMAHRIHHIFIALCLILSEQ